MMRLLSCISWRNCITVLALQFCLLATPVWSGGMSEDRIKTAYIYNFITLTGWPDSTDKQLNLCVHASDPFAKLIQELDGEKVGERSIKVLKMNNWDTNPCHAFFISQALEASARAVIKELKGRGVLTVTDIPDALDKGFIIGLRNEGKRIVFIVNQRIASQYGLTLSSKLLRMAVKVKQ